MRANVKPLTHWLIYRGYSVRFKERSLQQVTGVLTTADGPVEFAYDPETMVVHLPTERITINQHGWELNKETITP
jgi:hypothetical protein